MFLILLFFLLFPIFGAKMYMLSDVVWFIKSYFFINCFSELYTYPIYRCTLTDLETRYFIYLMLFLIQSYFKLFICKIYVLNMFG